MKRLVFLVTMMLMAFTSEAQSFVWFRNPDEVFNEKVFKVVHIWSDKFALAYGKGEAKRTSNKFEGQLVLLTAADGHVFYDDQVVEVKRGSVPMVIGVYRFEFDKKKISIPVVAIKEKENTKPGKPGLPTSTKKKKDKPKQSKGLLID